MNTERVVKFVSGLKSPRTTTFRNCFEGGMDYETALGCAGLLDQPALRIYWDHMERQNNE
jgi:hypothetical protein